jgi:hypothetical protein
MLEEDERKSGPMKYPRDVAVALIDALGQREWLSLDAPVARLVTRPYPVPNHLPEILEFVFFASFLREEGAHTSISVVLAENIESLPPRWLVCAWQPMAISPPVLQKMASTSNPDNAFLIIATGGDVPVLSGIACPPTGRMYGYSGNPIVVTTLGPGALAVGKGSAEILRYVGGRIQHPVQGPLRTLEPKIAALEALRNLSEENYFQEADRLLERMAWAAAGTGHGALLAFSPVPENYSADAFGLSIPMPIGLTGYELWHDEISYQITQEDDDLPREEYEDELSRLETRIEANAAVLDRMIDQVGRFSSLDGAVLLNQRLELVAFGCKLPSVPAPPEICQIRVWPENIGTYDLSHRGTRHRAAAAFAAAHEENLAICISQDGPINAFFHLDGRVACWPMPSSGLW